MALLDKASRTNRVDGHKPKISGEGAKSVDEIRPAVVARKILGNFIFPPDIPIKPCP